jgi:recombination DNA repair RAD52 pathway protein
MTNSPTKTQAADKAKKEAVTNAIKRGLYSLEQIVDSQVKGDASMWKVKQEM